MNRRDLLRKGIGSAALLGLSGGMPGIITRTAAEAAAADELPVTDFASLKENVYAFHRRTQPRLYSGAIPVFAMLGDLDYARANAVDEYIERQNENGFFIGALDDYQMYPLSFMSMHELFIDQRDDLSGAIHLRKLPPHPLRYLHALTEDPDSMTSWIESLPWHDPWPSGNLDMDIAYALAFDWKLMGNHRGQDALAVWFDWHDRHFDPETGFWDPLETDNLYHMMAGAMHQYGIYFMFGRGIPYPEEAIDATIRLQTDSGLFTPYYFSHNSSDIDGVFILANLYNRYGVREREVKLALEKAFEANLQCFLPTGGAVSRLGVDEEADWWSTWCRTAICGWCARILGIDDFRGPWNFQNRHPFVAENAGKGIPDWDDPDWYRAVDWPRPA